MGDAKTPDTKSLEMVPPEISHSALKQNQVKLDNLLRRRFFIAPSFEIYGSSAGLFDFGPPGCAVKNEIEAYWRRHFVLEEDLLEISGPNLTPHVVLKASGHVDRFLDLMVEDTVTRECFRADKLIEEVLEKVLEKSTSVSEKQEVEATLNRLEGMDATQMRLTIQKWDIKSPQKNRLSEPYPFNLMFSTKVGPKQDSQESGTAYLRPETAQGIFVNFRRLLEQNASRMPFGAACIGTSFRNEIAPRNGLLRVREFPMAEIEYFCDSEAKSPFPKFRRVKDIKIPLYSRDRQVANAGPTDLLLEDAVNQRIIDNETLAYFIGRTFLFLTNIGVNPKGLRFRQHLETEMAHYASDCWDAEILTSFKWIECVGIADRSAYDLTQHTKATRVDLRATRRLKEPRLETQTHVMPNRKLLGPRFKKDLQEVLAAVGDLTAEEKEMAQSQLYKDGSCVIKSKSSEKEFVLTPDLIQFETVETKVSDEPYVPNVIEPSFGIGRIMYALFEHAFRSRGLEDQEDRNFLLLSPLVAPVKCSILPISSQAQFAPFIEGLRSALLNQDLSCKIDSSTASIGKRYARTDEIGTPFGVTIDFQTVKDSTVTLREINTMEQIRIPIADVPTTVKSLVRLDTSWADVCTRYPLFLQQDI
eukprot:Gregarina_sp_Poly_1__998@NODE_1242_length_4649_cov_191_440637_g847_i0_p1_GENE_NODE_1242_length_4649_cov_191_440637_g847_i0NODE_1242_length_4649_cov_191_440637_g847_i0_p1_ORF_typecomplete_len652_score113_57tRNAsynt_2b/PF00587_25/5_2e03tRNAsynt_2b/PF00587_25/3_8e27tRNAsynt_2b/PF00587_25/0_032HGTP_anticodon/PF03129_20/2_8e03HGTP_anticodon/PF03129_20/8_1e18_NODE_1242_length_4649_cov_191_440637_g847_i0261957